MRRTCAIQKALNLSKIMVRWRQLLDITGYICNGGFMLVFTEMVQYFWPF